MRARDSQIQFEHVIHTGFQNNALIQDRDGFLWIGSSGGLIRYDGYELKFYKKGPGALSSTVILAIREGRDGVLWIGTNGGLNKFDKETGAFTSYRRPLDDPKGWAPDDINSILEDREGTLWMGTQSGLRKFDQRTGEFTNYEHHPNDPTSLGEGRVWSIFEDRQGALWIGAERGGLCRFDKATQTFTRYAHDPNDPNSLSDSFVTVITEDKEGVLWIGTGSGGLNTLDPGAQSFRHYRYSPDDPTSLGGDYVLDIYEDREGVLWVGCFEGGLCRFNRDTQTFTRYQHDPRDPTSLTQSAVSRIYQDRSGILWILLMAGQMDRYNPRAGRFKLYQYRPNDPDSLSSNVVLPIYEDREGVVWIGTGAGGLNRFNRETETFSRYTHDPVDPDSLPSSFVSALFEDSSGTFWVATSDNAFATLSIFDRRTGKCLQHYTHDPKNPTSLVGGRVIRNIIQDRDDPNVLWMAVNRGGLEKFDKGQGSFTHYQRDTANPNSLHHNEAWQVYQDRVGALWIAMQDTMGGGVDRFDKRTGVFTHYLHHPNDPKSLGSAFVQAILEDASGTLWFGTENGLDRLDRRTGTFTRYTTKNGLPDNMIYGILEDKTGHLWISTDSGLARFNPRTETFKVYRQSDGLQADAFFYSAYAQTRDGEMWFGGLNGVNRFYPEDIVDNPNVPPIVLTSIKQGSVEVDGGRDPSRLERIELDWQRNYFEFEFAALEYTRPDKNQYAYMLEGFDADWYYAGTKHFGRYSNLPGGQYTLRLKGANSDGIWNEQGLAIQVTVSPPAWQAVLRESEQRFRSLVETSSDWIWEVDKDGRYTYASPRIKDILGYEPEEVIGRSWFELMPPDEAERVITLLQSVEASPVVRLENTCLHKDGRRVVLETNSVPILDENGRLIGHRGIDRDITERKQAEEARRRYALRLERLHEIDGAILAMDSPEKIALTVLRHLRTLVKCERASVMTFDYAIQMAFLLAVDTNGETHLGTGRQIALASIDLEKLERNEPHYVADLESVPRRDEPEEELWADGIHAYIQIPMLAQGKLVGTLNFASSTPHALTPDDVDIAQEIATSLAIAIQQAQLLEQIKRYADEMEQRVAERTAQLEAANRELEAFSYSVSHDLRAPLRAVDGFSRILLEDYAAELPPETARYLVTIRENTQQMGRLIDDLLAFSRLIRQPLIGQPIATADLVRQALESLSSEQEGRRIEISMGELPPCHGDPALLRQVWINLLSNALKFTRRREVARIEVGCKPCDGPEPVQGYCYFVKDNGVGFDMRYVDKLFGVFQRLHRPDEYEGAGVGLAIVKRIIDRHGGRVWAEAEAGKGATFYFTV